MSLSDRADFRSLSVRDAYKPDQTLANPKGSNCERTACVIIGTESELAYRNKYLGDFSIDSEMGNKN